MKLYYRAVTQDGKVIRGFIEAKDIREAAHYLRKHQFVPVKIIPADKTGILRFFPFLKTVSQSDLVFFTRQLASTMSSGLTVMQALQIIRNQMQSSGMGDVVQNIINDVENGKSLSLAIEKYPAVFSPIYTALIKAAESSGLMDKVLLRLAENLEKQQKLQRTIRGALIYPIIVVALIIVVIVIMMVFVIPKLTTLYSSLNLTLPLPTLIIVSISTFFVQFWLLALIGIIFIGFYLRRWYKKESGRRAVDKTVLKLPIFGKLISQSIMAEFTRTLGLLVGSGSLVVDSLVKCSDIVGNIVYREAILLVAHRVEKGITIGDAMESSPLFPTILVEMVRIGEQTGKLNESLIRVADYYESEVEETVKTMTTLMEPIIMVILAFGVGFLIFAVITPIYNLISSIQ